VSVQDAAGFWEARYAGRERIWSDEANLALVAIATRLRPGRALDLGCGEGADSVWLAEQGWWVTGVDVATTAITRAKALAARHDIPAGNITFLVEDLGSWQPVASYELVSACFLHSPVDFPRTAVLRRAASTVTPGGHLLIVGHAGAPPWAESHDTAGHRFLDPAEELASLQLDETAWETVVSDVRQREASGPRGEHATLDDAVVLIRRRIQEAPA
jgi:SAM-dependent methyltransferase